MTGKHAAEARRQKRLFEVERQKLQRNLPKAVRAAAKGSGWRSSQGTLFQDMEGWFIEVRAIPYVIEVRTPAHLHVKPMGLDALFWKICGMEENANLPLSFRAFGAFTCRTPAFREVDISEEGSVDQMAGRLLGWASDQASALGGKLSLDDFVQFVRRHPAQVERQSYLPALVVGLLLQEKSEEALAILKNTKRDGGFWFHTADGMKTFADFATEWIEGARCSRIEH